MLCGYHNSLKMAATAVAGRVSALGTSHFLADRKARADFKAFDKIMKRRGGERLRQDDERRR